MTLLPMILIFTCAALIAWWLTMLIAELFSSKRRRLKDRLSDLSLVDPVRVRQNLMLAQMEASGVAKALAKYRFFQKLYRNLLQAWPNLSLGKFLFICCTGAVVGALLGGLLLFSFFFALLGFLGGLWIPFLILNGKRARRQRTIADQLPEALDFLSRILKAGHSLTTGIQMIADELPAPLSSEFRRCYEQHSLGQPLEDSFKEMSSRIDSPDFAFFITAILIQRQTGGDLSELLGNISGMIRGRIRLAQQVKSKTAEGRFTGYILVAFPIAMFLIMYAINPDYTAIMFQTNTGLGLLGIAVVLIIMGLFAIRKITKIRV
jgi:tight adherence protein B